MNGALIQILRISNFTIILNNTDNSMIARCIAESNVFLTRYIGYSRC